MIKRNRKYSQSYDFSSVNVLAWYSIVFLYCIVSIWFRSIGKNICEIGKSSKRIGFRNVSKQKSMFRFCYFNFFLIENWKICFIFILFFSFFFFFVCEEYCTDTLFSIGFVNENSNISFFNFYSYHIFFNYFNLFFYILSMIHYRLFFFIFKFNQVFYFNYIGSVRCFIDL